MFLPTLIFTVFFPTFVLPLLLPLAINTTDPQATSSAILCYDSRYATDRPALADCAQIIQHQIATPPSIIHRIRTFSRKPSSYQLALPHTWKTPKEECNVTIDIPSLQPEIATASLLDIKMAAVEVMMECVSSGDRLGGFTETGREGHLQVTVAAGAKSTNDVSQYRR
ncbi:MAG: hypothetical protein LQ343_006052 [Gyalolechia ehrenbergii]|nr:MAG: hypothetical protein LQ343_006052 [Gyalolechia ehrenbergii]